MTRQSCCDYYGHDCNQGRDCPERIARRVQHFETPQGRAAHDAMMRERQDTRDRQLWRIAKAALVFLAFLLVMIVASHAAPKAIATLADPLAHNPY